MNSRQIIRVGPDDIVANDGLGARHGAAIAITRLADATAVGLSQSTGTRRVYHDGHLKIRIDPSDE